MMLEVEDCREVGCGGGRRRMVEDSGRDGNGDTLC